MEQPAYQAWLTAGGGLTYGMTPAKAGAKLFDNLGCVACHKEDGSGRGPSLVNVYSTPQKLVNGTSVVADEAYIRESILNPRAKVVAGYETLMNTYQGQVSEEQILDIIAYLKSLGNVEMMKQNVGGLPAAVTPAATPAAAVGPAVKPPAAKPATK
jgi:cytochrome c oxidase subunit 2